MSTLCEVCHLPVGESGEDKHPLCKYKEENEGNITCNECGSEKLSFISDEGKLIQHCIDCETAEVNPHK